MARRPIDQRKFLRFNGSSTAVSFASFVPSTTEFSIAFWVRPRSGGAANDRILDWADSGPVNGLSFVQSASSPQGVNANFTTYGAAGAVSAITAKMRLGEWNHLVGTYAVNSVKLFLNGVQVGTTDTSATMTTAAGAFGIGKRTGGSNYFRGDLREFLVYSRVLTQEEITNLYVSSTIPVSPDLYLKMDERSGTSLADSSGSGRTGTVAGTALYGVEPNERLVFPPFAKAINFAPATTSVVTVSDTAALRPETLKTFTWMQWVYLFNTRNNVLPRFIGKGSHYTCFMGDQTNGKANYVALETENSDLSATEFWGTTQINSNRWYHIATTFNDGNCQHYVNGRPDAMTIIGSAYVDMSSTVGSNVLIGNSSGNNRNPFGLMQGVQMHNVVLTDEEILAASNGGSVTRGLVAKYNMDEGSGTTITDSSGNGYDGTLTGSAWVTIDNTRAAAVSRTTATNRTAV